MLCYAFARDCGRNERDAQLADKLDASFEARNAQIVAELRRRAEKAEDPDGGWHTNVVLNQLADDIDAGRV